MFYTELPAYSYLLPCGHTFRSLTRSVPLDKLGEVEDPDDGFHWLYCGRCRTLHEIPDSELVLETAGRKPNDHVFLQRIDAAIHCDRAARYYRLVWDSVSINDVVASTGVCKRLVERVANRLGVYGP